MLLYISDSKTVQDLQDRFNKCFPYLKLEFYNGVGDGLKKWDKSNLVQPTAFISDITNKCQPAVMDIKSWDKTSKVKQQLKDIFGLHVQIFRLYQGQWIPATYSDDLTLRQQTELAAQYGESRPVATVKTSLVN